MSRMHIVALSTGAAVAVVGGAVLIWQGVLPGLEGSKPATSIAHAPLPPAPAKQAQLPLPPQPKAPVPQPIVPQFDTVRVEPSGDTVVAGHGEPNAKVSLLAGEKILGDAKADDGGDFVILPQPLAPGNYVLVLRSTSGSAAAVLSQQSITVSVPEKGQKGVVVALLQPGKPSKLLADPTAQAAEPQKPSEKRAASQVAGAQQMQIKQPIQAASNENAPKPASVQTSASIQTSSDSKSATLAMGEPAAKPVQSSDSASASPKPTVAIKTAEVDRGAFYAAGIAPAGTHLRIYLNGSALADVVADAQGQWSLTIGKGVIAGHYVVRADAITDTGKVVARAEVPFDVPVAVAQAEQPKPQVKPQAKPELKADNEAKAGADAKADANATQADQPKPAANLSPHSDEQGSSQNASSQDPSHAVVPSIDTATVTRGDSLWRISRKELGEGIRYTLIYQANASQIRDPNLIYPGQVFVVPHVN